MDRRYRSASKRNFASMVKNMRKIQRVAGTIHSDYNQKQLVKARKYQRNVMKKVLYPPLELADRRFARTVSTQVFLTRTLYTEPCCNVPIRDDQFNLNSRERNVINAKGIKVWWCATAVDTLGPGFFNIALIAPKDPKITAAIPTTDFFRGDGADARDLDFSTNLSSLTLYHRAINTDKYDVIWRKKYMMNPKDETQSVADSRFTKLDKQIRFDADDLPLHDLKVVFWIDRWTSGIGSVPVNNAFYLGLRTELTFNDPK